MPCEQHSPRGVSNVSLSDCFDSCTRPSRGNCICSLVTTEHQYPTHTQHNVHKVTRKINRASLADGRRRRLTVTNSNGSYFRVYLYSDICIFKTSRGICHYPLSTFSLGLHSRRKYQQLGTKVSTVRAAHISTKYCVLIVLRYNILLQTCTQTFTHIKHPTQPVELRQTWPVGRGSHITAKRAKWPAFVSTGVFCITYVRNRNTAFVMTLHQPLNSCSRYFGLVTKNAATMLNSIIIIMFLKD